jgi:N-acetylglucosamine-6-phosphate deacetylase
VLDRSEIKQLERVDTALARQPVQVLIALTHTEGPWLAAVQRARRTKETTVEMSVEALEEWFRSPTNACVPRAIAKNDSHDSELLEFLIKSVQQDVSSTAATDIL